MSKSVLDRTNYLMNETQKIEFATAKGFLALYNAERNSSFHVEELADSPDVRCVDSGGRRLNLEITLTEDWPRDIQAALGRSDHLAIENFDPSHVPRVLFVVKQDVASYPEPVGLFGSSA